MPVSPTPVFPAIYRTVGGEDVDLTKLDPSEREMLERLQRFALDHHNWDEYSTFWMRELGTLYDSRSIARSESAKSAVFQVAGDIGSRLAIQTDKVAPPTYLDQLTGPLGIFHMKCAAVHGYMCRDTGWSFDEWEAIQHGKPGVPIKTLTEGLRRLGYVLQIAKIPDPFAPLPFDVNLTPTPEQVRELENAQQRLTASQHTNIDMSNT